MSIKWVSEPGDELKADDPINAVKYISRAGKKDPAKTVEDLKKAAWYLQREIERAEKAAA